MGTLAAAWGCDFTAGRENRLSLGHSRWHSTGFLHKCFTNVKTSKIRPSLFKEEKNSWHFLGQTRDERWKWRNGNDVKAAARMACWWSETETLHCMKSEAPLITALHLSAPDDSSMCTGTSVGPSQDSAIKFPQLEAEKPLLCFFL